MTSIDRETLREKLASYPRVSLLDGATPLDRLQHLGERLGIEVWLKRDDLTPLALGGDKPRKLEYELARAIADGADVIVTCGSSQSNHARLTTAAARHLGLEAVVVLSRDEYTTMQGNLLTVHLMGAEVIVVDTDDHWDLDAASGEVIDRLRSEGQRPYYVPVSGTTVLSCLGYVSGALEMIEQLEEAGVEPDFYYLPFGTGGIFTATLFTLRALGSAARVRGVSVNRDLAECEQFLDRWWEGIGDLLDIDEPLDKGDYSITDRFIGRAYGDPAPALHAIITLAETEGVLVDPVYSGKVLSGLIHHAGDGTILAGSTVAMIHSGGTPALFAYHEAIAAHLEEQRDIRLD